MGSVHGVVWYERLQDLDEACKVARLAIEVIPGSDSGEN